MSAVGSDRSQIRAAWILVGPAVLLLVSFFLLPVVAGLLLSLTDFDIYAIADPANARFVGLANYAQVLSSDAFRQALANTLYFVLVGGPLSIAVSLAAAVLVEARLLRGKRWFRTAYFVPVVTTLVAVAIVWRYLYHPDGIINHLLRSIGASPVDWLGNPRWAMPAIILLAIWKNFGYNMLILVAGLQAIPEQLYEAAEIDGAGGLRRFLHVTLPGLGPVLFFVSVTTTIGYFQLFAEPYVMTQGGPLGATRSIMLLMYEEGFRWWRMGDAATLATFLLGVTLAGALIQIALRRRLES
ncbi:MAG: sugar ABC transporter permease [bacterium]